MSESLSIPPGGVADLRSDSRAWLTSRPSSSGLRTSATRATGALTKTPCRTLWGTSASASRASSERLSNRTSSPARRLGQPQPAQPEYAAPPGSPSSLFEHLCESNAIPHNPVKGAQRPAVESYEGKTPALGDHQARQLLAERHLRDHSRHHSERADEVQDLRPPCHRCRPGFFGVTVLSSWAFIQVMFCLLLRGRLPWTACWHAVSGGRPARLR